MKKQTVLLVVVLALLVVGVVSVAAQQNGNRNGQGNGFRNGGGQGLAPVNIQPLSAEQIALMEAGYLDEMNAYNLYGEVLATFGNVRPFVAIQRGEAQHAAAWERLFTRYGLTLPTVPTVDAPTFASVSEACAAAAEAEIANLGLYEDMYTAFEGYPDIQRVVSALGRASEVNHLPAFERCAG